MLRKMKTMDGNTAAAYVSYAFTEVAAIYPITPSSVMADETDKYSVAGKKNLFGQPVKVTQMLPQLRLRRRVDRVAGAVPDFFAAGGSGSDLEVGSEVLFFHQIL